LYADLFCCQVPISRPLFSASCATFCGPRIHPGIFRAVAACAMRGETITPQRFSWSNRPVRHGRQQKKDRSVSLVCGGGSAAFRAAHDDFPFGRRDEPPPCPTTPAHGLVKNMKLIRPRHRPAPSIPSVICLPILPEVQNSREAKTLSRCHSTKNLIRDLKQFCLRPGGPDVDLFKQDRALYRWR